MAISIPGFENIRNLSEGGSSTIYRAVWALSREVVAVKVAKSGYEDRIRKEAGIQYKLSNQNSPHPHIVTVISSGDTIDDTPYFAMELMDENLKAVLRRGLPDLDRSLTYLDQILGGLGEAHDKEIVYLLTDRTLVNLGIARYSQQPTNI